ncbi:MAG: NADH-quinone oxidoreductase subunit C [Myxococcales bacterium]|nr:NADH-quinone oxidoreductase subunit C [Myxococcales bacterium]
MAKIILDRLKAKFAGDVLETSSFRGDDVAVVKAERWREIAEFIKTDAECLCDYFVDLSVIDNLDPQTEEVDRAGRFEVYYIVYSVTKKHRVRVKARLDGESPSIATLVSVWSGANWMEREAWDMYGVDFEGHPDQRRILLYEEFKGHPLRKDYPANRAQPLIEYREGTHNKLGPFLQDEGMPLNRSVTLDERSHKPS